jgi:hypothetical protein
MVYSYAGAEHGRIQAIARRYPENKKRVPEPEG